MAAKRQSQQKDHEFSVSSGQMVGMMVGLVVIVLMAFVIGLLIGRFETNQDLVDMQRRANQAARTTVPLGTTPPKSMSDKVPEIELPAPGRRTTTAARPAPKPVATRPKPTPKPVQAAKPTPPKVAKPTAPEKKPPVEKPKEPVKASVGKYGIQVSANDNKRAADEHAAKLVKAGYDAWVRPPATGSRMHGVMVGRFATQKEAIASELFKKVKAKKEFAGAWVPVL